METYSGYAFLALLIVALGSPFFMERAGLFRGGGKPPEDPQL